MAKEVSAEKLAEVRNSVVADLATARGVNANEIKARYVGNNGFAVGDRVKFTGKIEIIKNDDVTPYYGAMLEDGGNVSVQSLMGLSSLTGYKSTGEYTTTVEHVGDNISTKQVEATYGKDDLNNVYKPKERELFAFVAYLKESEFLAGKTGTYLGQVVRPYTAKKDSDISISFESWKKGDPRCQVAKLWHIA